MHFLNNKKAFLGLVGLLLVVGLLAYTGKTNKVVAEGGNSNYLPVVSANEPASALADSINFGDSASWTYFDKGKHPGSGWTKNGFDVSSWSTGPGPFGYGEPDLRTQIKYGSDPDHKYTTTYFRQTLTVDDVSKLPTTLYLDVAIDDGAVFYINGKRFGSINMTLDSISYATLASSCELKKTTKTLPSNYLVSGVNTLAVEVHQCGGNSSDLLFSMALRGDGTTGVANPTAVPTSQPANPTATPKATTTQSPNPTATPKATTTQPPAPTPVTPAPTLPPTTGRSYYVTTSGSSSGDGSSSRPWSLQTALSQPSSLRPGDTVWVRGGTYKGAFRSTLKGSSSAAITVRAYPGERAILSYAGSSPVLDIYGSSYVNFWGLEITSSYSTRTTSRSENSYGLRINQGPSSHHVKFINMIVHDVQAQGFGYWQAMTDSEIYGSLFYFNGVNALDHGVYVHNVSGTKTIANNFIFDNASHGLHGYAETAAKGLTNIHLDRNTLFNNGSLIRTFKRNILVGGGTKAINPVITNNNTYYPGSQGQSLNLGYSAGSSGAKVTNNYLAGGSFQIGGGASSLTMTGNTVYAPGGFSGFSTSSYSNNTWTKSKPSGLRVTVNPNKYEPNRANITIYNWGKQSTVTINASSLGGVALKAGDKYELRNVQNYFNDIVTGTYDGSSIQVPMTGHSVAQPVGLSFKPATTFPEFGAFVLIVK